MTNQSVTVDREYDGQLWGTIPLVESGPSFKTTYSVNPAQLENGYLYANGFDTYELTIEIENIGDADARTSLRQITMSAGLHTSSRLSRSFSSTPPGGSESVVLAVSAAAITTYYEDFEITDLVSLRTWEDCAVLRFSRTPGAVRTRAFSLNSNTSEHITVTNGSFTYGDVNARYYHTIYYKDRNYEEGPSSPSTPPPRAPSPSTSTRQPHSTRSSPSP